MKTVCVIGSNGRLGQAVLKRLSGICHQIPLTREDVDLSELSKLRGRLSEVEAEIFLNCAALTAVDYCEDHEEEAELINGQAVGLLAEVAAEKGARLIHFSTDYVFDGKSTRPYREDDPTNPINAYGRSKLLGEQLIAEVAAPHVVIRTSWLFGLAKPAFPEWIIAKACEQEGPLQIVGDKTGCVSSAEDLARLLEPIIMEDPQTDAPPEIFHLCNREVLKWSDYGRLTLQAARKAGLPLKTTEIQDILLKDLSLPASRPLHSALSTQKYEARYQRTPQTAQDAITQHILAKYTDHAVACSV